MKSIFPHVLVVCFRSATLFALLIGINALSAKQVIAHPSAENTREYQAQLKHNKDTARRVYTEGLSQGIFTVPYTDDFVGRGGGSSTFSHEDGIKEAKGWRQAFPDLNVTVDMIIAEDDLVSVRWTATGTNTGAGNGIPATGKRVRTSGTTVFRFANGAIAEEWTAGDALGLMKQLGLLPSPASSTPSTTASK